MTVSEAQSVTENIEFGYAYSYALTRVAQTQAQIGEFKDAFETVSMVEDPRLRAHALWSVAAAQIAHGDENGAGETAAKAVAEAESVGSGLDRAWALCEIALEQNAAGKPKAALETFNRGLMAAKSLKAPTFRARALAKLADTFVRLGL